MADRITGRLNDGAAFVHSETGDEGVGHFTTQRRLPEIICKLARLEDKIENGELVEVVHGEWLSNAQTDELVCSECDGIAPVDCEKEDFYESNYCPNCGAKMDRKGADNAEQN